MAAWGAAGVPDLLSSYTANRLRDKAAVMKEKRKAAEETRLRKGGDKGGKGE